MMNQTGEPAVNRQQILGVFIAAVLVLAVGYWWGHATGAREGAPGQSRFGGLATPEHPESTPDRPGPGTSRRILYYRNPMGRNDTSPVPRKDAMGMAYVPVYDGEEPAGPQIKISVDRVQKLGVRTEAAAARAIGRTLRAVGTVQADERGLYTVSPKFEGWIATLFVNTTGARVHRGQPLLEVYSPDLVTAQQDYRVAAEGLESLRDARPEARAGMQKLLNASLTRLRNYDIADSDLDDLRAGNEAKQTVVLRARADGVVLAMTARAGMRFMAGEALYQIANLSRVWVVASVFEQDLSRVHVGQTATVSLPAYPGRSFTGKVAFIYPTVQPETRTARVRIELANPDGVLKPDLYGTVDIAVGGRTIAVAIPVSAVLDTGTRQVVLIERNAGTFEPREVQLGARGDGYVEALQGVADGERVVINGNFLIDSESNLKAALGSLGGHAHGGATPRTDGPATAPGTPNTRSVPTPSPAPEHTGH